MSNGQESSDNSNSSSSNNSQNPFFGGNGSSLENNSDKLENSNQACNEDNSNNSDSMSNCQESSDNSNSSSSTNNQNSSNNSNGFSLENNSDSDTSDSYNNDSSTKNSKKEALQKLHDKLEEYSNKKKDLEEKNNKLSREHLDKQIDKATVDDKDEYKTSDEANQFLSQLEDLPAFKDRDRGDGYSIDSFSYTELPDSIIRTLISKFLNQRFCKRKTDLNVRSNSLEKAHGFYRWEPKDVIIHLETEQITKVLNDKYGYEYSNGKNENVPLSFYFDMSGSMSSYTNMLAVIAIELLKKNVKVLIGFNEIVNVQIESINKKISVEELSRFLEEHSHYNTYWQRQGEVSKSCGKIYYRTINNTIDKYLITKKAEKCVVFSDFDPIYEVINLSLDCDVYWFCFERKFNRNDLKSFNGFIYKVKDANDIMNGLIKVNEKKFEVLCYVDNPKKLIKR
jgi:hypothetical protein